METWGFTPRSPLTWIKPRLGLGNYLRNATEHLIFGTRGDAPVQFRAQPTWMFAPLQDHSHKPEEQYAVIERVSDGPYLELFARRRPPSDADWSVWGTRSSQTSSSPAIPCRQTSATIMLATEAIMPKRRQPKTNRVPQDQRHLRVRGMRRGTPDAKKLSRAFIGLALARAEAEARAQSEGAGAQNAQGACS